MLRSSSTRAWTLVIATAAFAAGPSAGVIAQTRQTAPVPMPFPGAGSRQPPTTKSPAPETEPRSPLPTHSAPLPSSAPAAPVVDPAPASAPNEATLAGVQIYPTAEFIDSFDAGNNQQYFLYGTNATFTEIVTSYRTVLKSGGRELSKAPGIQQFDLGRFQDTTMAYPPSVVVKDYTWNGSMGYLAIKGTTSKRYKTIIQVVPPAAR